MLLTLYTPITLNLKYLKVMSDKITKIIDKKTYVFTEGKWINERSNEELDPHDPYYRAVWDIKNK
jgi:hypothetical protein